MRQFVADSDLDSSGCLVVGGKKFRHMVQVLRVTEGDMIHTRLPDGSIQQMTVARISREEKNLVLQVAGEKIEKKSTEAQAIETKPGVQIYLFQFVAKPPKMDLIIRQATECGVEKIIPVAGKFCQSGSIESAIKKSDGKDERWARIITEAREQSGSPVDTKVLPCVGLSDALEYWKSEKGGKGIVLYEQSDGTVTIHRAFADNQEIEKVAVFVGAEGGISPDEIKIMKDSGITPVHLMTNILRCETAALYGLSVVQNTVMEKNLWLFRE